MIDSKILEIKNAYYSFFQSKLNKFVQNSTILSNIDNIILFFICATLVASLFLQSEKIGAIAFIMVLLTWIKLHVKQGAQIKLTKWDGALIIYFLICLASTLNSTLLHQSIHGLLKTVIYFLYYFCVANYFHTNMSKIKYIFLLVTGLCCFEGVIAIYQNYIGVEQISTWQDSHYINPEDAIARAYGTLKPYNPNLLGGYLLAGIPFAIGVCGANLIKNKYKLAIFGFVSSLISAMAILVTGSRGAYLGLGAIIIGLILLTTKIIWTDFSSKEQLKNTWKKIIVGIVGISTLILILTPKILKRILSIFILRGDSSTSFRMNVYNSSWQMFCDNWILGIGAGNQTFREIYGLYMLTGYDVLSTYSVPLEIAVESGILGLLAFVSFLVLLLINLYKFINSHNGLYEKIIVSSVTLTILGVMTHGMFDTIYFRPQVQFVFWTMIAIANAVTIRKQVKLNTREV